MRSIAAETIEHFQPKSQFPNLVCDWNNLYLCCYNCQKKGERYSPLLLRPEALDYSFERYFLYNSRTNEIEVNVRATRLDQERAAVTIELYQLNDFDRPTASGMFLDKYLKTTAPIINDFPFRYLYG